MQFGFGRGRGSSKTRGRGSFKPGRGSGRWGHGSPPTDCVSPQCGSFMARQFLKVE